jgi:dTDP-4-amino-4,6-dideoxygalactose transaminase
MPEANMPAGIPILDLAAQYMGIREELRAAIDAVFARGQFILGPEVAALEAEVAKLCGTAHAVGVASGTDALILALHAAGVERGDEVIVPAFTYIATADSVSLLGARPVFCDVRPDTLTLDVAQLEKCVTARTKAIVPVHLFGQAADMDGVLRVAGAAGLAVIEDAAQAIGATWNGEPAGSLGDCGCLSFFPTKNLGAAGDAGMIVTSSPEMAARLRSLRVHGTTRHKYLSEEQGWNSRLDELQAAILRVKLRHLEKWTAARQKNAALYDRLLAPIGGVIPPKTGPGRTHVYHQYTIRLAERERVQKFLAGQGISSAVYYPVPLHLQPMFAHLGYEPGSMPQAERAALEVLSLPIYPELEPEQIERVAAGVAAALRS